MTTTRTPRRRAVLLALLIAASSFVVEAAPTETPLPRPEALTPQPAKALACADHPAFEGRITSSKTSATAITRSKTGNVYGYISKVVDDWSCTAYYRYDGLAWARDDGEIDGNFNWGNLIHSTSVPCNWHIGETNYLKANSSTDCHDSDSEYAMPIFLANFSSLLETTFHNDVTPDAPGDFGFIHSDCTSYYGAEPVQLNESWSSGDVGNRPGSNCDPTIHESTNTSQSIVVDDTPPTLSFSAPAGAAGTVVGATSTSYGVTFNPSDNVANFGASSPWSLKRQVAPNIAGGTCGTFVDDSGTNAFVTGTTEGSQGSTQTLVANTCYRWILSGTDLNGNVATPVTSATVIVESTAPTVMFVLPSAAITRNSTSYPVTWLDGDRHGGVASRSLQRQRLSGTCTGSFSNDGSPVTTASPSTQTLTNGFCYQWIQTITDRAGNTAACTSSKILVDTTAPMSTFSTPASGITYQSSGSVSVAWTETAGSGSVNARSLQRHKATGTIGTCSGLSWATDGSTPTSTAASPVAESLSDGTYRWIQTLGNTAAKSGPSSSGWLVVDSAAPSATITAPAANAPLAGPITIEGTATDAGSFTEYELEYGVGASPSSWTSLGTWTVPVSSGDLATWDPGALSGVYTIRLTVRQGASATTGTTTRTVVLENARRGEDSSYTRVPFDLGGGWALDVGVANGEARLARDLFEIPSFGPPQALALSYSSLETSATGRFGVGWHSNLTQYLTFDATDIIVWHRADGGRVPFGKVASTWTALPGHFETLSVAGGEVTITATDQTALVFENSGAGRLKRIENRFGEQLALSWSASSANATDASGRVTTVAINSTENRITAVTDSAGRAWSFGYSGTGAASLLTTITDPESAVTTLGYTSNVLTTVTRSRTRTAGGTDSVVWTIGYGSGKATSVDDPESSVANAFTYNAGSTDYDGIVDDATSAFARTTYELDVLGRVTTISEGVDDEVTIKTTREYDDDSNITAEVVATDDGDAMNEYTYDAAGNVLTQTDPIDDSTDVVTVNTYNATNDLLTTTTADNDAATRTVTKYTYDGSGHLTSVNVNCTSSGTTPPGSGAGGTCTGAGTQDAATNLITSYAYTADDQVSHEEDPAGRVTYYTYDSDGNQTSVTRNCTNTGTTPPSPFSTCTGTGTVDAATNVTETATYDGATTAGGAGLATTTTDALGRETDYTFDDLGRQLTEDLAGDGSIPALTRTSVYDEFGNVLTEDEDWAPIGGGSVTRTTTHTYDLANRETEVEDSEGVAVTTDYDAAGNAIETTSNGVATFRDYDLARRLTIERIGGSGAGATTREYTELGVVTRVVRPSNEWTSDTVDFAGRVTSREVGSLLEGVTPLEESHYTYDLLGRELTVDDEDAGTGADTTNTYDRLGRLLTSTSDGAMTSYAYDRAGNQVSVTDPLGIVTTTTFDALDRPTTVIANDVVSPTVPSEDVTTRTYYDRIGAVVAVQDPEGITTRTILNAQGLPSRVITDCTDSGTTPTSTPASCVGAGTTDSVTNVMTDTTYDGSGQAVAVTSAVGLAEAATTETAYDEAGRVVATRDPMGTITRTKYDAEGRVTDVIVNCTTSGTTILTSGWAACTGAGTQNGTFNLTTITTYDDHGNVASVEAPNGRVTTYIYDAVEVDRLIKTIDNDVASPTLPHHDVTTETYYDAYGRAVATRTATVDGASTTVTRTILNDDGTVASVIRNCTDTGTTVPADDAAAIACTGAGTKNAATNVVTSYDYDDRGNRIRETAPDPSETTSAPGSPASVITQYAFDDADRLCRVVENATGSTDLQALANPCATATQTSGTATTNVSTRYTYDDAGNLATMIDARGNTTTYGYDAAGRMTEQTDALAETLVWAYDAQGNRIRQENRADSPLTPSVSWTYDAAGRELTRVADSVTVTSTYDLDGNRLTADDGTHVITATYDRLGRPLTVDDEDAGTTPDTTYTYSLTSPAWTDPTGSYTATLDPFDRVTGLNDPANGSDFAWSYRADGQPSLITRPDGNYTELGYDALGHLTSSDTDTSATTGGTDRAVYAWTHNRAGQVLSETSTITGDASNGTVTYGYDPLGRLTGSTMSATTTAYGWDSVPNRTSVQVGAGTAATTTYDAANRPSGGANPSAAYTSDDDGRLLTAPGFQYTWDRLGRVTSVKNGGGTTLATYTYDPLDRLRLIDYPAGTDIRFRYTGLTTSVAQWLDHGAGTVTRSVANGWTGEHLADWTGASSNIRIYGTNAHHDVTWLAASAGTVSQALRYDPWGTPRAAVPGGYTPFRFQGSWFDDVTSLSWVVTRWYAPSLGRFISEDSLLGQPIDPPTRHLYAYGEGEPIGRWDPDGRWARLSLAFQTRVIDAVDHLSALSRSTAVIRWSNSGKPVLEAYSVGTVGIDEDPFGLFFAHSRWDSWIVSKRTSYDPGTKTWTLSSVFAAKGQFRIEPAQGWVVFHAKSDLVYQHLIKFRANAWHRTEFRKLRWRVSFSGVATAVTGLPGLQWVLPLTREAVRPDNRVKKSWKIG